MSKLKNYYKKQAITEQEAQDALWREEFEAEQRAEYSEQQRRENYERMEELEDYNWNLN